MKVLHLTAIDASLSILLKAQLEALKNAGYTVHTACRPGPGLPALRARGYLCHEVPVERSPSLPALFRATRALYRLFEREKYDIVHTHTPVASIAGRVAARLARVPHVFYTAHGFYFHERMHPVVYQAHVALERGIGRWTEHLFCQSDEDRVTAVSERIMPPHRVSTLSNGVDTSHFSSEDVASREAREAVRKRHGIPEDALVIGFVGRPVVEKGICELLEAMQSLVVEYPHVRLVLVGNRVDGDRGSRLDTHLRQLLDSPLLAERIIHTGMVKDVAPLVNVFDVFALPSYREGMPRSILEAMAAAKPVVATDIRGCREEVVNGQTGFLVPARTVAPLAHALARLLSNSALREQMGMAGQNRARNHFEESMVCGRLLDRYAKVPRASLNALGTHNSPI